MIPCRPFEEDKPESSILRESWLNMELVCAKYNEKMDSEQASCRHPNEYCKYRTSCIIHFLGTEQKKENRQGCDGVNELHFAKGDGLIPAVVQDYKTNDVLMLAYINEVSWQKTLQTGKAHYWSRSRNTLWLKGESSGHVQMVKEILVDCDGDTVIFKVEQLGGAACHTGHRSCFFRRVSGDTLEIISTPVFDPREVYGK